MTEWQRLLLMMAQLRDPETGCPWDQQQTGESLVPYTLEEAYEVADAVQNGDAHELCDELGDLLFHVVFYARIAEESNEFSIQDVLAGICEKLWRRHPHVFGDVPISDPAELSRSWDAIKTVERQQNRRRCSSSGILPGESALDGVAHALPALIRATKLQARAARAGFEWPDLAQVLAKVDEELAEVQAELLDMSPGCPSPALEAELGDLLLAVSHLARYTGVDPESALRKANHRFEGRFRLMESGAVSQGRDFASLGLDEMLQLWSEAKSNRGQV